MVFFHSNFLYIQACELLSSDIHLQFFNYMYMYIETLITVVGGGICMASKMAVKINLFDNLTV